MAENTKITKDNGNENSYRSILKGTSLLGGVQVIQILVNLVRGKFVAMFLGPDGMGISSLFASSSNTINQISSLGLNMAVIKEVAASSANTTDSRHVLAVALRLTQLTAMGGALFCALFSPWLSRVTFGSNTYAWQFLLLSVMIYLTTAGGGKLAILQGMHELKRISKATLTGSFTGLVVGVPLYYFFGTLGIVPAMVILSFVTWAFYSWNLRKVIPRDRIRFNRNIHKPLVKRLLSLGVVLMSTGLLSALSIYLLNIFLRKYGEIDTVGLYQAANSITNQYSGVVFTAMSMDYMPRLSKVCNDRLLTNDIVNRQAQIVAFIVTPLAILLILSAPIVIRILLTVSFLSVTPLMRWMGFGIILKAISFPMGYIAFAKGDKKLFFWLEGVFANLLYLVLACLFFNFFGFIGLGYSMVVENFLYLIIIYLVTRNRYGYRQSRGASCSYIIAILLGAGCFLCSYIHEPTIRYVFMSLIFALSATVSILYMRHLLKQS